MQESVSEQRGAWSGVDPAPRRGLRPLKKLWPYMQRYRGTLALALLVLLLAAAAGLGLPVGIRLVIDEGFSATNAQMIDRYFLLLFGLMVPNCLRQAGTISPLRNSMRHADARVGQ